MSLIIQRRLKQNKKSILLVIILSYFLFAYVLNDISLKLELLNEYIEIELLGSNEPPPSHPERFVMYRCDQLKDQHDCGGLGDRMKGILSAYLWSLLDNRTLIVQVNRPCNLVNLLEPNEVNWSREVNIGWWQTVELDKRGNELFKERLKNIKFTQIKRSKQLIILHNNRNYFETVGKNRHYINRLRELGFDPNYFDLPYTFRTLFNRLFKLPRRIQKRYDEFLLKAKPTPDTFLVCAQIRVGGTKHARKHYLDLKSQPASNSKRYRALIREKFLRNVTNFRVFLTTDNRQVYDDFLGDFGSELLVHNEGPFNHIDYVPYSQDPNDCSSAEKGVLDFYCLSECDAAVISRSQFGRMGMWRRKDPSKNVFAYNTDLDKFVKIESMSQYRVT